MHGTVEYQNIDPGKENIFFYFYNKHRQPHILKNIDKSKINILLLDVQKLYTYKMQRLDATRIKKLKSV